MNHKVHVLLLLLVSLPVMAQTGSIQRIHLKQFEAKKGVQVSAPHSSQNEFLIPIRTQAEFDKVASRIREAIKKGNKNIRVSLPAGVLHYSDVHINLYDIQDPELSLCIEGNKTVLIPVGNTYSRNGMSYDGDINLGNVFLTAGDWKYIDLTEVPVQATEPIEVLDQESRLCRVKTDLPDQNVEGASIIVNEWYQTFTYPLQKIADGYIYFTATNLKYDTGKKCFNVNYDQAVGNVLPRYRLVNMPDPGSFHVRKGRVNLPGGSQSVYECKASQFLVLYRDTLKCFQLRGITFCGSRDKAQVLFFRTVKAEQILVSGCTFRYLNNIAMRCDYTDNVVFSNNVLEDCFARGVWIRNDCNHASIVDNVFTNTVKRALDASSACVTCVSENYYIARNTFRDFGIFAIFAGIKYTQPQVAPISGIIENNEIYYTPAYASFMEKYSLIDCGAIYLATCHDETIVRYNYIHGYTGISSARSIYCDDGCYQVKIYGNVIVQPEKGYAIFSWRSKGASKKNEKANTGIDVMYNVIWGQYSFDEKENGNCIHGRNIMISNQGKPNNKLINFTSKEEDVLVSGVDMKDDRIVLSGTLRKQVKKLPTFNGMKHWFK